jgi:hypothetical protein
MAKTFDLFLSHNSADKPWTQRLASAVEADRTGPPLKVFFDKWDIPPGADIPFEVEQGLQNSRYVGLVLSPESLASDWSVLERSTAIFRDPAARQRGLLPLMRRTCELPDMLARLKYIDFRRDQDFEESLSELVGMLRGVPARRSGEITEADVHFREDADLLRKHRRVFDRPAFRVPCIMELFLSELSEAIDDTAAGLNTGSLYSRSSKLLSTFEESSEYRLPEFRQAFRNIGLKLTALKRMVVEFDEFFQSITPGYSHHRNFYAMVMSSCQSNPHHVQEIVQQMDGVDRTRNEILEEINALLGKCREETFALMELSSTIIGQRRFGGSDRIAELLSSPQRELAPRRMLGGRNRIQMARPEVSMIASLCLSAREKIERGDGDPNHYYESLIMRGVKADVYNGMKDDPLARIHLGHALNNLPTESLTAGPRGEEVRYFGVRTFPSGDIVGLFGIWPGRESDVYAVVVDEKFPEYFGLFLRSCTNLDDAEYEWMGLTQFEQLRNEALGEALKQAGWQQLVPQPETK